MGRHPYLFLRRLSASALRSEYSAPHWRSTGYSSRALANLTKCPQPPPGHCRPAIPPPDPSDPRQIHSDHSLEEGSLIGRALHKHIQNWPPDMIEVVQLPLSPCGVDYIFYSLQKLSLDYTERHNRPRKLSIPMSYSADHSRCTGQGGYNNDLTTYFIPPPHPGKHTPPPGDT